MGAEEELTGAQKFFRLVYRMQKARHLIEENENLTYLCNKLNLKSPEEIEVDEWIKRIEKKYEEEGKHKFWEY